MPKSVPYRCLACMLPGACGYHGLLRIGDAEVPVCDHDQRPPRGAKHKPPVCHDAPIVMVPVR